MHDIILANEILNIALKEAKGRRIISVKIALAEDGHITIESLSEAFDLVTQGTLAEGARLEIQKTNDPQTRLVELEVEED